MYSKTSEAALRFRNRRLAESKHSGEQKSFGPCLTLPPKTDQERESKTRDGKLAPMDTEAQQGEALPGEPASYSVFRKKQKIVIVCLIGAAGLFSPFTASVYFPALQTISSDFGVSIELINITVTAYLILQGIIPSVLGDLSESIGRRPTYLMAFVVYCAASIGLALQREYGALLVLRMLQSTGSSPAIALAYGVIGDIAAPHERGAYIGATHIGFNSAPALGPIIGGLLADRTGWPWIFVFLAGISGLLLVCLALFLDGIARRIVGNSSISPTGINRILFQFLHHGRSGGGGKRIQFRVPTLYHVSNWSSARPHFRY